MYLKKAWILLLLLKFIQSIPAQSVGGITTGAAFYCDSLNSGFISLTAYTGQILYWQSSVNNGTSWIELQNTTSTQSYNKLMQTTSFRAVVKATAFPQDMSSVSTITVYVPGHAGKLNGGGAFCEQAINGHIDLTDAPGSVLYWQSSLNNSAAWATIANTTPSLNYTTITTDISYRAVVQTIPGCPADTTPVTSFSIHPKTVAGIILKSDSFCYGSGGDTLRLTASVGTIQDWFSSANNGNSWQQLSNTTASLGYSTVTQTTWYKASVKSGVCPTETATPAVIAVYSISPANAGNDVTITRYQPVTLKGSGQGHARWNNAATLSNAFIFDPGASPLNTTTYTLTLTDQHGCITEDSVTVHVIVPIPTAITPNGDGANDYFEIDKIHTYEKNSLMIFNRWGLQVYSAAPYTNQWNGKSQQGQDLPDDLYYYVLDYGNGDKPVTNYILIKR